MTFHLDSLFMSCDFIRGVAIIGAETQERPREKREKLISYESVYSGLKMGFLSDNFFHLVSR